MFSHATSIAIADAIRVVTVIEMALVVGLAVVAAATYIRTERNGDVTALTLSYVLLAVFAIAEITGYYGSPLTWRTPIGFTAGLLGAYALMNIIMTDNGHAP